MQSASLGGLDSLLSMAQMPAGIPVGTLAIGRAGAVNAALLAAAILALSDAGVAERLAAFREEQTRAVLDASDHGCRGDRSLRGARSGGRPRGQPLRAGRAGCRRACG